MKEFWILDWGFWIIFERNYEISHFARNGKVASVVSVSRVSVVGSGMAVRVTSPVV